MGRVRWESPMYNTATSAVWRVEGEVLGDLGLPPVAVRQQLLLIEEQFLVCLSRELEIRPLDDGIDRTGLLAVAAIDALRHVDVVARRAPAAVLARLGLDRDRQRWADRLAQLAGDAALFAVGVPAQHVLAAEARAQRTLLVGVVDRDR